MAWRTKLLSKSLPLCWPPVWISSSISRHKKFEADLDGGYSPERVDARREFFHRLISEEAVFAYNGDDSWLDVHPVFHVLRDFKDALDVVPAFNP